MSGHDEPATITTAGTGTALQLMGVERLCVPSMGRGGGGMCEAEGVGAVNGAMVGASEEPPRKRAKPPSEDTRARLADHKLLRLKHLRDRLTEQLSELYFLQAGGNMMDYATWRRRPVDARLQTWLDARCPPPPPAAPVPLLAAPCVGTVVAATAANAAHEEAVERARAEAQVSARVAELARQGLWAERRLPRVLEPPRHKAHWDYLLEEMAWLAQDFAHERKWKKQAAKKCARAVQRAVAERCGAAARAERARELQLRRVAAATARDVRAFWHNVQKVVEWKRSRRVERARKLALEEQLSYVVDRTEQYSRQVAAQLSAPAPPSAASPSPPPSEYAGEEDSADDEDTIAEQERVERPQDVADELAALHNDADMDLADLVRLYAGGGEPVSSPRSDDVDTGSDGEHSNSESVSGSSSASSRLEVLVEGEGNQEGEQRVEAAAVAAAALQPRGTTLASAGVGAAPPTLLRHTLREYQHVGLHWLATMHDRQLNGILADEMGLGKTIQTIALLAQLVEARGDWGPHLVVAPTSLILNWEMEFKKWCPAFKILTYYGTIRERKLKRVGWTKPNCFHICITSYKLVVQDHQSFRRKRWKYLILDEAQNIKNFKSQRWQILLNFQTERRLLLTGTPLQNSLAELWSLLHFLMPAVFASHAHFREWFAGVAAAAEGGASGGSEEGPLVRRLHQVLRPFLLRRLKADVERQLPRKYEHVLLCRLATRQRYLYDDFMARAKTKECLASGNLLSVINVLMQLRKVCNHPDLFEPRPVASPLQLPALTVRAPSLALAAGRAHRTAEAVALSLCGALATFEAEGGGAFPAHRARHLAPPRRALETAVSPCAPPRPPPAALRMHLRLVPRTPTILSHAPALPAAPNHTPPPPAAESSRPADPMRVTAARLEARRRACLRRLAVNNERRCCRQPLYGADLRAAVTAPSPIPPSPLAVPTLEQLINRMLPTVDRFSVLCAAARAPAPQLECGRGPGARGWRRGVHAAEQVARPGLSAMLRLLHAPASAQTVSFPHPRLLQYDCGKLQTLCALLRRLRAGGHRVLIFTQMTRVLDVLEAFLSLHGHPYLRLDGATPLDSRQRIVDRFNGDVRVFALILSTRSGGLGLNLTGADTVVFYDSDWNPTWDAQAMDRAHRIGQTRDVHVYRLVTSGTVEENILRKADQKRRLGDLAIDSGRFTTSYLRQGNIRELFECTAESASEGPDLTVGDEATGLGGEVELETALAAVEDEADAAAARAASHELRTDLAEFDDAPHPGNLTASAAERDSEPELEPDCEHDEELRTLIKQLRPIERYAMRIVENSEEGAAAERAALEDVRRQCAGWRAARDHLRGPDQDQENEQEEESEHDEHDGERESDLTYCREDADTQVWVSGSSVPTRMPMWCPPTPPSGDGDVYCEAWARALYRLGPAADSLLPAVRRDPRAPRSPRRARVPAHLHAPPSLFERGGGGRPRARPRPHTVPPHPPAPDWSPCEEAALRRALRLQRLEPAGGAVAALAPNWDWVAEAVNEVSRAYRSARSCRDRADALADPERERARRKHKKATGARRRPDEEAARPPLSRLDAMRELAERRRDAPRRRADEQHQQNPKHAALLTEYGLEYEVPPSPMQVAARRADRIAKDKLRAGASTPAASTATPAAAAPSVSAPQRVLVAHPGPAATQLLYRTQPQQLAPRHHLKILHHAPAAAHSSQASGSVSGVQSGVRRAPPTASTAPARPHLVVAHLAPAPPVPPPERVRPPPDHQ